MKDVGGEGSTPERSDPKAMVQQGQTFELRRRGTSGERLWAYRYRAGGRDSRRVQHGGFASEQDARDALERELERLRRERRITRRLTLSELVDTYLDQHDVQPVTIEKLRYLLSKATVAFGDRFVGELTSKEIAAFRMTLSTGYRFEATQALRHALHRAVAWGMIDVKPAKVCVDNPVRRRKEQHPFESWTELEALAAAIGPRYGPMIHFAAATGLRPAEWIALEKREVGGEERVVFVRRSFTRGELKIPKTEASATGSSRWAARPSALVRCGRVRAGSAGSGDRGARSPREPQGDARHVRRHHRRRPRQGVREAGRERVRPVRSRAREDRAARGRRDADVPGRGGRELCQGARVAPHGSGGRPNRATSRPPSTILMRPS
jgi:integrase